MAPHSTQTMRCEGATSAIVFAKTQSATPGTVKLWESPGRAGGLPKGSYSLASDSDQGQVPLEDPSPPQRRGKG